MDQIAIEPVGGFVGGGSAAGPLHMRGEVAWSALSDADRAAIERLFAGHRPVDANLRYRLTRTHDGRSETIEAPADAIPAALIESIRTSLD